MESYDVGVRKPCRICGRQFVPESLAKHEPICKKSAAKKTKVFDSAKQRAEGTEVSYKQIKQAQKKPVKPTKSTWRAQHEDFINTVRAARDVTKALERGEPLPPPPPPSLNPDYVQCPHCARRFNQKAAERHINFCKEQQSRIPNRPAKADPAAKAKMAARNSYQPPKPKLKSSPGLGESSGYGRAPASQPGVGRTPPGASNGVGRGGPSTRGRSTGTTSYQAVDEDQGIDPHPPKSWAKRVSYRPMDFKSYLEPVDESVYMAQDFSDTQSNGHDNGMATGKALRTGRGGRIYQEARRDIKSASKLGSSNSLLSLSPASLNYEGYEGDAMGGSKYHQNGGGGGKISYHGGGNLKESESGYYSSNSETEHVNLQFQRRISSASSTSSMNHHHHQQQHSQPQNLPKFCHECGSKFPVTSAKFCCECGSRRFISS